MSTRLKVILIFFVLPLCGLVLWAYCTYGSGGVLGVGLGTVILLGMAYKPAPTKTRVQKDREFWRNEEQRLIDQASYNASQADSRGNNH